MSTQPVYECIWVIAEVGRDGQFRKMSKVTCGVSPLDLEIFDMLEGYQKQSLLVNWPGEVFFLSAEDAFKALNQMDPDIAKSFAVFEIKIDRVFKLASPADAGISLKDE